MRLSGEILRDGTLSVRCDRCIQGQPVHSYLVVDDDLQARVGAETVRLQRLSRTRILLRRVYGGATLAASARARGVPGFFIIPVAVYRRLGQHKIGLRR